MSMQIARKLDPAKTARIANSHRPPPAAQAKTGAVEVAAARENLNSEKSAKGSSAHELAHASLSLDKAKDAKPSKAAADMAKAVEHVSDTSQHMAELAAKFDMNDKHHTDRLNGKAGDNAAKISADDLTPSLDRSGNGAGAETSKARESDLQKAVSVQPGHQDLGRELQHSR